MVRKGASMGTMNRSSTSSVKVQSKYYLKVVNSINFSYQTRFTSLKLKCCDRSSEFNVRSKKGQGSVNKQEIYISANYFKKIDGNIVFNIVTVTSFLKSYFIDLHKYGLELL